MWQCIGLLVYFSVSTHQVYSTDYRDLGSYQTQEACEAFGKSWVAKNSGEDRGIGTHAEFECDPPLTLEDIAH